MGWMVGNTTGVSTFVMQFYLILLLLAVVSVTESPFLFIGVLPPTTWNSRVATPLGSDML